MNFEYFLYCKKKYYEIKANLDNIIETYDVINYCIAEQGGLISELCEKTKEKSFFVEKRGYIIEKINNCNSNLYNLCDHEFVEDMIDITPERSENITYCKICEYTK